MLKFTVELVAFTPDTVPLSSISPLAAKALDPVQMALYPLVPDPVRLLPAAVIVICPGVEVVIVMLVPATRLVGA